MKRYRLEKYGDARKWAGKDSRMEKLQNYGKQRWRLTGVSDNIKIMKAATSNLVSVLDAETECVSAAWKCFLCCGDCAFCTWTGRYLLYLDLIVSGVYIRKTTINIGHLSFYCICINY